MTVPFPVLDDRDYDQLLAELRARIPVYAPEWTDLGPSDPGITLLELLAHLAEGLLFRFNQIPDQTRTWLLRLLQVAPYPPRVATGVVTFAAADPLVGTDLEVPLGSVVTSSDVPFRVRADLTVLPLRVTAAVKSPAPVPTDEVLREEFLRVLGAAELEVDEAAPYETTVLRRQGADGDGVPVLEVTSALDRCLWVAVDARTDDSRSAEERTARLLGSAGSLALHPIVLGFGVADERPALDDVVPCTPDDPAGTTTSTSAATPGAEQPGGSSDTVDSSLVWQVSAQDGTFLPVGVVRDTTAGLRRGGVVGLQLPVTRLDRVGVPVVAEPDLAGVGDRPPSLGDPPPLFWLRAFPREGVPEIGRLTWVGANAADVEQVAQAPLEVLGRGQGLSRQELALANAPVVPGTLTVEVLEAPEEDGWRAWDVVDALAASGPQDRHLLLDPAAGRLECGDSVRGRVLPFGALVRAPGYRYGGGRRGNVAADSLTGAPGLTGLTVTNPLPTSGGEEPESLSRALERIPGELTRKDRAVVAADFRELATVPGVGRAECLPRFDPRARDPRAAGVVTVMVWPAEDPVTPDAPTPSATLLQSVCERLDARRLVTTELYVVPPVYHRVAVSVGLAVRRGYSAIGVRRWVELALRQYLSPLPPFGPEGRGWPLGRRVHGPELEAAVLQVQGVEFVEQLLVAEVTDSGPVPGTVALAGWEVPVLEDCTVVVGTPPAAGSGPVEPLPPASPQSPAPVPVPVPRDEC